MASVSSLLDMIYVPACAACDARVRPEAPMCAECMASLDIIEMACPRCALPQSGSVPLTCRRCCQEPPPLSRVTAVYRYGGQLAEAISRLKFRNRPDVARTLAPLFGPVLEAALIDVDLVVPIPLHWRRHAERGYNQSQLLLAHGARGVDATMDVLTLRRTVFTAPQHGLSAAVRKANVRGVFEVPRRRLDRVRGKRVLLIDDVMTTGETLRSAARALRAAGADDVQAFAVARAEG